MGDLQIDEEVAQENGNIHVLLVTLSAQGHINPMLILAKVLISKGLHITLATTEVSRKRLLTSGASTINVGVNSKFNWEFFSDGLSDNFDRGSNIEVYFKSLFTFGPQNISSIINKLNANVPKISSIIYNPFVPWVVDTAFDLHIPCAMLWIQPCALYSIYYHFYNELSAFPTMEKPDILIELPGLPCLRINEMPSFIHPFDPFPVFKKLLLSMIKNLDKVKWVLGSSFFELEKEIINSMSQHRPITPVGPLVPSFMLGKEETIEGNADMWEADDSCLEWLDTKPPASVVYISFGSTGVISANQMENIALALKRVGKPFLWVVKPSNDSTKNGKGELPNGFINDIKEQGIFVTWCTQARVLNHPSIACFMSHCGWNSLLEAVVSGIPVIALPQWTDQPANSKMLVHIFKMGVELKREDDGIVTKEEIERCILDVTQGPKAEELKNNATRWMEEAKQAVGNGGSSDRNLDIFIDDIKGGQPIR